MAKSMNGQLPMFSQTTCEDSSSAISSPALEGGATHCGSQDGLTLEKPGRGAARVSRFRALDSGKAMSMDAISGPLFIGSSPSATLQSSLESRLRARMDVSGSPEYVLIWKCWDMPAGVPICALRASSRLRSGSGFTGWPTPTATDASQRTYTYDRGDKAKLRPVADRCPSPLRLSDAEEQRSRAAEPGDGQEETDYRWPHDAPPNRRFTDGFGNVYRIPESGLSFLADGFPGIMGQIRAAGNAIVPQVAQVFIEAYCEARGLA